VSAEKLDRPTAAAQRHRRRRVLLVALGLLVALLVHWLWGPWALVATLLLGSLRSERVRATVGAVPHLLPALVLLLLVMVGGPLLPLLETDMGRAVWAALPWQPIQTVLALMFFVGLIAWWRHTSRSAKGGRR
jgi:hypothetical protein